jgi:hypothetical protein
MQPDITINYLAVAACVLVAMPVGFLWFGPLFGQTWAAYMGMRNMKAPDAAAIAKSMAIYAFGSLLTAFVLAHSIDVWRPSAWRIGTDAAPWIYGVNAALWTWLGFFLPVQMGRVAWEQKEWGLVMINAGFDVTRLMIFGLILSYWQ